MQCLFGVEPECKLMQFAKLEETYIQNVTVVPHIHTYTCTYIHIKIHCEHGCTVYVGLRPNYIIYQLCLPCAIPFMWDFAPHKSRVK